MTGDVTDREVMRKAQGERVLVHYHGVDYHLTIVHVVGEPHELRLVNRDNKKKTSKPDWALTQIVFTAIHSISHQPVENCNWEITVR